MGSEVQSIYLLDCLLRGTMVLPDLGSQACDGADLLCDPGQVPTARI